jgi:hypothetical protein
MDAATRADHLRHRADHLRTLATEIERLPVMSLERWADDDTWRGARPLLCRTTLHANQQQLHAAADDLRLHAWRFELEARQLDAVARFAIDQAG